MISHHLLLFNHFCCALVVVVMCTSYCHHHKPWTGDGLLVCMWTVSHLFSLMATSWLSFVSFIFHKLKRGTVLWPSPPASLSYSLIPSCVLSWLSFSLLWKMGQWCHCCWRGDLLCHGDVASWYSSSYNGSWYFDPSSLMFQMLWLNFVMQAAYDQIF